MTRDPSPHISSPPHAVDKAADPGVFRFSIAHFLVIWALAYSLVWHCAPDAFIFTATQNGTNAMGGFTALYFSFITLNTVGYGDIVPGSDLTRMLAMTESTVGVFYMAVLIARLVSLYTPRGQGQTSGLDDEITI